MSIDKFEQQFLNKSKKQLLGININLIPLLDVFGCNMVPYGNIIEIRAKELSGIFLAFDLIKNNKELSLLVDSDKTFDENWQRNNRLLVSPENKYKNIFDFISWTDNVNIVIFNTVLGLLPIDSNYQDFKKELDILVNHVKKTNKILIFINPYLDNKYDIISNYADLVIVNKKRTSIKKNEERLGYNVDGEIIKNTINFKLGKFQYQLYYKEGLK